MSDNEGNDNNLEPAAWIVRCKECEVDFPHEYYAFLSHLAEEHGGIDNRHLEGREALVRVSDVLELNKIVSHNLRSRHEEIVDKIREEEITEARRLFRREITRYEERIKKAVVSEENAEKSGDVGE